MANVYDWAHAKRRKQAIATLVDGTKCPICKLPMTKRMLLDLNHIRPLALGGSPTGPASLTHSYCNRSQGAKLGNRLRAQPNYRRRNAPQKRKLPRWLSTLPV